MHADDVSMDRGHEAYLRARTGAARNAAMANLLRISEPFIRRVVRHLSRGPIRDLEPEDALQQARIGFVDAVHRCDPERSDSFRPFAINRIRHELQSLAEKSVTIKIPRRAGVPESVMRQIETIRMREGREPTRAELNGHAQAYDESLLRPRVVTSFDAPGSEEQGRGALPDLIGCDAPSALELLIEREESAHTVEVFERIQIPTPAIRVKRLPRKQIMTTHSDSTNSVSALDALDSAIKGCESLLKELDEKELSVKRERESVLARLNKLAGIVKPVNATAAVTPIRAAAPLIMGQDSLPHRIVRFLKANPSSRLGAIAKALNEKPESISVQLTKLRESKQIKSEGKARGTSYSCASRAA